LLGVRIQVRMILAGKFPVRLLDLVILGGSGDTEDFVVVAKLYRHVLSLLQSNFEALPSRDRVGIEFAGIVQNFLDVTVFVIGVVMIKDDTFGPALDAGLDGLFPAAMAPPGMAGQFFRRILRIGDEAIGILGQCPHVLVAPLDTMFNIGAIGSHLSVLLDAEADRALRMIQRQNENARAGEVERSLDHVHVVAGTGQVRHIDREIRTRHQAGQRIHARRSPASGKVEREVIPGIVQRPEKRDALNMVEMEMAEENMSFDGIVAKLLLQVVSEQTKPGSTVENENLVGVGPNLNAGGIASIPHVLPLWCGS
jgi:hypothetical protein